MTVYCDAVGCGAEIRMIVMVTGKRMVIDAIKSPDGTVIPVDVDGAKRGRMLRGSEMPYEGGPAFLPHIRTCGRADPSQRLDAGKPRCSICNQPMDPELTALENWLTHPSCDIDEVPRRKVNR